MEAMTPGKEAGSRGGHRTDGIWAPWIPGRPGAGSIIAADSRQGQVADPVLSAACQQGPSPSPTLRNSLGLTDGTLSVHLTKLEEGGLVSIEKTFEGKKPLTLVRVTPEGRRLFKQYVADLRGIVPGLDVRTRRRNTPCKSWW